MKDKFNTIDLSALPKEYRAEFDEIKSETDNFQDQDVMDIYEDNFNDLYDLVKKRYPEAIKGKKKLKIKKEKPKEKKKLVIKKARPSGRADGKDPDCDDAIDELTAIRKKREDAAIKRAAAPERRPSTLAGEKQVLAFKHAIKTSDLKDDKTRTQKFAKDLAKVYRHYGMDSIADKILEAAKPKAEHGSKTNDAFENFDIDKLDPFERRQYDHLIKQSSKKQVLGVLIANAEGDHSELSPALAELAEKTE